MCEVGWDSERYVVFLAERETGETGDDTKQACLLGKLHLSVGAKERARPAVSAALKWNRAKSAHSSDGTFQYWRNFLELHALCVKIVRATWPVVSSFAQFFGYFSILW